jgi:hypothetical protein
MSEKLNASFSQNNSKNKEEYYDEFDGVKTSADRGVAVEFGIPLEIEDISSRKSNELEADSEQVTRNIAILEVSSTHDIKAEFTNGVKFEADPSTFAFAPLSKPVVKSEEAPPFPFYLQPAHTSFRSNKSLVNIRSELEKKFSECSVVFAPLDDACGYSCSALQKLSVVDIDVNIYEEENKTLLVEFRHLKGCRYAFSEVSELLANSLEVEFFGASSYSFSPPELKDDALPELPVLQRGESSELKCNDDVCDCKFAMDLLSSSSRHTLLQGLRATGVLVKQLADAMDSCKLCGACGAQHYNHEQLFAEGSHWMQLTHRVEELAKCDNEDDEVRTVAMSVLANIMSLQNICKRWLVSAIPTVVTGINDDLPHIRREALRSVDTMATRDKSLAAKLVRSGVVPSLELEANGGDDDQCPDVKMQQYAQEALRACRA